MPGMLVCVVTAGVWLALGCDAGGLLVVTSTNVDGGGGSPQVLGPSVTEFVNAGNVASNTRWSGPWASRRPTRGR
jgi:hypothetical protein